jgi:hypothetical protein
MKAAGVLLLAALAVVAVAGDLLVRVELASDADIKAATALNAGFLGRFDGWFLVRIRTEGLSSLSGRLSCRVLDADLEAKQYVYAHVEPDFDRQRLAGCGTILTEDSEGMLLSVTGQDVTKLNCLPVELCAVFPDPVRSAPAPGPSSLAPRPAVASSVSDSLIWQLMARASQDSAEAVLRRLRAFQTRYSPTESCWSAVRWFQSRLTAYGCDTTYLDTFELASPHSDSSINAIGVKRGRVNPNQIYVVCGHVDNTSAVPYVLAPGSDDNASGSGLVLEAARMFQGIEFDYTVWFIGFSGEEQGFFGSSAFVGKCFARGDSIVLAINHDMISWTYFTGRDSLRIVGKRSDPPCSTWVESYMAMADTFTDLNCRREIVDDQSTSDHYTFWRYGYAAIRDGYLDRNPVYHTIGDTIGPYRYFDCGTNNIPVYTEAIKATVATVARLAGARPSDSPGVTESRASLAAVAVHITPSVGRAPVLIRLPSAADGASVYNSAGRQVRRLGAGQVLTWDGRESSGAAARPGVYYFRATGMSARFILAR